MTFTDVLIFAASSGDNTAEAPDSGLSAALIIGVLVGVVLLAVVLFTVFHKTTRASRGGGEPPPGEFKRGEPPFESVHRKADPQP